MNTVFYNFFVKWTNKSIKVLPKIEFDQLKLIGRDSGLIEHSSFYISEGVNKYDVMQFNSPANFVFSQKVKDLLESNNITGWGCFPITIEGIDEPYYCFQMLSMAGPILNLEQLNNLETRTTEFDINTWDGSDFFYLENTLGIVCTERVKLLLEKHKIKNLDIYLL